MILVNEYGRSAWNANQVPCRTGGWTPIDALLRYGARGDATYETYEPSAAVHRVWELAADEKGVMRPHRFTDSPELVQIQNELEASSTQEFDASNDEDARKRVLVSIARRQGQPKFRYELLAAIRGMPAPMPEKQQNRQHKLLERHKS